MPETENLQSENAVVQETVSTKAESVGEQSAVLPTHHDECANSKNSEDEGNTELDDAVSSQQKPGKFR